MICEHDSVKSTPNNESEWILGRKQSCVCYAGNVTMVYYDLFKLICMYVYIFQNSLTLTTEIYIASELNSTFFFGTWDIYVNKIATFYWHRDGLSATIRKQKFIIERERL